jgi:hypothetical protein
LLERIECVDDIYDDIYDENADAATRAMISRREFTTEKQGNLPLNGND